MVDAVTVFVVERFVVFITAGNVVAHPDFGRAAFFFDETGGFRHEQIEGEAGQSRSGGGDLLFDSGNFEDGIGIGNVVVDGDICKFVDLLFAGVAPDEVLGDLAGEVVGVDGNEFHIPFFRFDGNVNGADVESVEVHKDQDIPFVNIVKVQDVGGVTLKFCGRGRRGNDIGSRGEHGVDLSKAACTPENFHGGDGGVAACTVNIDKSALKDLIRKKIGGFENIFLLFTGDHLKKFCDLSRVLLNKF